MTKAIASITLDPEVKEKSQLILKRKRLSLSKEVNNFLKELIKKEENINGNV